MCVVSSAFRNRMLCARRQKCVIGIEEEYNQIIVCVCARACVEARLILDSVKED